MHRSDLDLTTYGDASGWATSLANVAEVMVPCIDATGTEAVAEIGAFAGDLTRMLADWAQVNGGRVIAIDPSPQAALVELDRDRPELELDRRTSLEALPEIVIPDVVIIDGDHNHWTVTQELRLIAQRTGGTSLPLLMFHDVCWPHARRDDFFDVSQIPADARHPLIGDGAGITPDDTGSTSDGLPYPRSAAYEGGARNGVLTAVEDFVAAQSGLRLAVVPAFFGFGVVWHEDAPWAEEVARLLDPWDRNSLVARLEANRVHNLVELHRRSVELWQTRARLQRQETVLRRLLGSSAFGVAERLSRLRARIGVAGEASVISKAEVRRSLGD